METLTAFPKLDWGVAERAIPGETQSGDQYLVELFPGGALIAVADGLGHGPEASAASRTAIDILRSRPTDSLTALVEACHLALLQTRGVVFSLARINAFLDTLTWLAVGNVEGYLLHENEPHTFTHRAILLRSGVVGYQLPRLQVETVAITPGDWLALATDGIGHQFIRGIQRGSTAQSNADRILAHYGKQTDDNLALVVRYWGLLEKKNP